MQGTTGPYHFRALERPFHSTDEEHPGQWGSLPLTWAFIDDFCSPWSDASLAFGPRFGRADRMTQWAPLARDAYGSAGSSRPSGSFLALLHAKPGNGIHGPPLKSRFPHQRTFI